MSQSDEKQLKTEIYDALRKWFGYKEFRSRQYDAISFVLNGSDVVVLMPTGGGKSLCYQIPPLVRNGMCVVVSPLIALMQDQLRELKDRRIPCAYLSSAQTSTEYRNVIASLRRKNCPYRLLYVTPERLQQSEFMSILHSIQQRGSLVAIAIDEAHCISTWGHDFRSAYRSLSTLRTSLPGTPIMALSATATASIVEDIKVQLNILSAKTVSESFDRPNIFYSVVNADNIEKNEHIVKLLESHENQSVIIYVRKKDDAESLRDFLRQYEFSVTLYHGSLSNNEKEKALADWTNDRCHIIVATIAFGMGINKNDVRLVVHWNLPQSLYNYYQESGRAGRDGLPSDSVVYYSNEDAKLIAFTIKRDDDEKRIDRQLDELSQVMNFCKENTCRRKQLLKYFQEEKRKNDPKKCCDYCRDPQQVRKNNAVVTRLPSARLRYPTYQNTDESGMGMFQTARELFQQQMESDEQYRKKKAKSGQMFHVNADGKFSDSDQEEEESLAQQIKRQALMMSGITPSASKQQKKAKKTTNVQESIGNFYGTVPNPPKNDIKPKVKSKEPKLESQTENKLGDKKMPLINSGVTHPTRLATRESVKTATSKKRPLPTSLDNSSTLLDSTGPEDHLLPMKLTKRICDDIKNLAPCIDVTSKQRIKCVEALQKKYKIALSPYLPSDWVDCIAYQQARLQEHKLIASNREEDEQQVDIRSFFGKKAKGAKPDKFIRKYKAEFTKIFEEVVNCGKDGLLPPFLPISDDLKEADTKDLMLRTKCRWSLLPFFSPEALKPILKHVVMIIAKRTPGDETKEDFVRNTHMQVDKAIRNKQPFLLRNE